MRGLRSNRSHDQANTEKKVVQSIRPVNVVTDLHQEPTLPSTVTVEYDKGFPKAHKVTWQAIPKENSTTIKPLKF